MDVDVGSDLSSPERGARGEDAAVTGAVTERVVKAASGCSAEGRLASKVRAGPSFPMGENRSAFPESSRVRVDVTDGDVLSSPGCPSSAGRLCVAACDEKEVAAVVSHDFVEAELLELFDKVLERPVILLPVPLPATCLALA